MVAATLAAGVLLSGPAQAFNLGNLTALSALGEPLRLEFEVLDLSPADISGFRVGLASPQDFAARGLAYGPVLEGMRLGLTQSANGRWVILIEGQRPAPDPFVDLLLNIAWPSGSSTRSVSVLLRPSPGAASTAELPRAAVVSATDAAPPAMKPAAPANTSVPPSAAAPTSANGTLTTQPLANTLTVQRGDTAGAVAQRERPPGVEQSQYLVALVQVNPGAFVEGNVNRLRAGAELALPTQAQATATPAPEARQIIAAQWQEFEAFRQRVATNAASAPTAPGSVGLQAQGRVDSLGATQAPTPADKLTLSKPSSGGATQADKALLDERQTQEAKARLEELTRTVRELDQLQTNVGASRSAEAEANAVLPAVQPAAKPPEDAAVITRLADHPAVLPVAGGLLALALAWLGLRLRRKVAPESKELDLDLELDLDEQLPGKSPALVASKTEPSIEALLDLETEHLPARKVSRS